MPWPCVSLLSRLLNECAVEEDMSSEPPKEASHRVWLIFAMVVFAVSVSELLGWLMYHIHACSQQTDACAALCCALGKMPRFVGYPLILGVGYMVGALLVCLREPASWRAGSFVGFVLAGMGAGGLYDLVEWLCSRG